jgi:predicted ATPase/DNA-binding CsgD family transcriptional regulator
LPAEWTSFVDRRRDLADIKRLLSEQRLVTLTGVAGVGKTRLARRAAEQLVRTTPGGVWWADLDEVTDPELVPHAVVQALDLPDPVRIEPVARLVEFFSERPSVLVLDNCEHLIGACAVLVGALLGEVAELRILATSREVLQVAGEQVLPVEPLRVTVPEQHSGALLTAYPAIMLFCQRAAAAVPGFTLTPANEATVVQICERLDGLPLAIELAAVRLRALSPEQILHRLGDRLDLLVSGPRTASARQRTLRGALDWSYDLCTEAERLAWRRLSVFEGGFDLDAAEFVCGLDPVDLADERRLADPAQVPVHDKRCPADPAQVPVHEVIDGLVGKSILIRTEDAGRVRFRLLNSLARYGREKTPDPEAMRARHAEWYAHRAAQAAREWFGPGELVATARLHADHANLREAMAYLISRADGGQRALRMVGDLWFYWTSTVPASEAQRWLDRALAHDREPTRARARALWVAAYVATIRNEYGLAQRYLAEAEEEATALGDLEALSWTACRAAILAMLLGDFAMTEALAGEALARADAAGTPDGAVAVFSRLALTTVRLVAGELDDAWREAEWCRAICAARGERTQHGTALVSLGRLAWMRGDLATATEYARDALRMRPPGQVDTQVVLALEMLGWIAGSAREHERVAVLFGGLEQIQPAFIALAPSQTRPREDAVAAARAALGEAAYIEAYEHGAGLSVTALVGYALGQKPRRPAAPDADEPALTAREQQVATLVASGLSNRQIASQLVISQRTAETHIENVLRKLNFTSRAQIAAWAAARPSTVDS